MIWSISAFKEYSRCQRKWFYNHKMASRSKKDSIRNRIYLLSELESIDSWRGRIVDYTISEFVLPSLQKNINVTYEQAVNFAHENAKARYKFAKAEKYKEPDLKKTEHNYEYAALIPFEYATSKDEIDGKFKTAWDEIGIALSNFFANKEMIKYLQSSMYMVKQRSLTYSIHGFTIRGVPDLIVFFEEKAPHIIDWKVHYYGTKTYNEQLLIYAVALKNCKPHKDFPNIEKYSVNDIKLTEFQLLKNQIRHYKINDDYVEYINDYIAEGLNSMKLNNCDLKYGELNIEVFEKTQNLDNCKTCQFKIICMEDIN